MKSNPKKSFRIIFLFVILVLLTSIAGIFLYSTRINYSYFPYAANHITVVFKEDGEYSKINSDEYILFDTQILEGAGNRVAIINQTDNQDKDIGTAIENSNSVYIDLFNDIIPQAQFINTFGIDKPFEVKSFLSKDSSVKMIYNRDARRIDFVLEGEELVINQEIIKLNDFVVFSEPNIEPDSFLKVGELIIDLSIYNNDFIVLLNDIDQKGIIKYKLVDDNLLSGQNFGFEQGTWEDQVANCSAYLDGEPSISMSLTSDATQGGQALRLLSNNHFACTLKDFNVELDNKNLYRLSFDYKNISGDQVQYYYNIKNQANQSQEKFGLFKANDHSWNNYSTIIIPQVPDAKAMSVYFYAPSDGSGQINNVFDNLKLTTFEFDQKINLTLDKIQRNVSLFNWLKLTQGINNFAYSASPVNLLASGNYSFESGSWTTEASDCSNYLTGEADFGMDLSSDSSNGDKALEISSSNHYACSFNSFPVDLDSSRIYQLSFDYKSLEGDKVQYFYSMKNNYDQLQDGFDSFEDSTDVWQEKQVTINPTITNPKSFDFYVYAPSDGSSRITNLYDNVRLSEVAPSKIYSYFLYVGQEIDKKDKLVDLRLSSINRWQDDLQLTGVTDSLLLVYPRQYADTWHLYTKDGEKVLDEFHYKVDGFSNAWWLDLESICLNDNCQKNPDGSYDISLEIINDSNKVLSIFKGLIVLLAFIFVFGLAYAWKK